MDAPHLTGVEAGVGAALAALFAWLTRGFALGRAVGRYEAKQDALREEMLLGFKALHARIDRLEGRWDKHLDKQGG